MKPSKLKPRNPFVAAIRMKKGGAHGKSTKAVRRQEKIETQRDLGRVVLGSGLLPRTRMSSNLSGPTSRLTKTSPFLVSLFPETRKVLRPDC